jgi:pilus assembly protein CpaC
MVQDRVSVNNVGVPWLADIPYVGELFCKVEERRDQTELILLAKAEFAEAVDVGEVSQANAECPGLQTSPDEDRQLYLPGRYDGSTCCPDDTCQPGPREFPSPPSARVLPAPATGE